MAATPRRFALDDAANRPGTYFNPTTEMLLVVDDSADVDSDIFGGQELAETDWVLVGDAAPVDETERDEMIEGFVTRHHPGATGAVSATEDDFEEIDDIEPDEDEEEDDGVEELEGF